MITKNNRAYCAPELILYIDTLEVKQIEMVQSSKSSRPLENIFKFQIQ